MTSMSKFPNGAKEAVFRYTIISLLALLCFRASITAPKTRSFVDARVSVESAIFVYQKVCEQVLLFAKILRRTVYIKLCYSDSLTAHGSLNHRNESVCSEHEGLPRG